MERAEAFKLVAGRALPAAITAVVGEAVVERYEIGNIVYYAEKPTIVPWRRQEVQFAQRNEGQPEKLRGIVTAESAKFLERLHTQSTLFASTGRRETNLEFSSTNYLSSGKTATLKADLGALYQVTSNLLGLFESFSGRFRADVAHPVVKKVLENGGHFFVVSTVYQAEKAQILVKDEEESQWREGKIF